MTINPGEARLWRAVILQALEDACHPSKAIARELNRAQARRWLLEPNGPFEAVCAFAGMDADYIRKEARRLIAEADGKPTPIRKPGARRPGPRPKQFITFDARTMSLAQWAKHFGMPYGVLHQRLVKLGWSVEAAFNMPVRERRGRGLLAPGVVGNFSKGGGDRRGEARARSDANRVFETQEEATPCL